MKVFAKWKFRKVFPLPSGDMEFRIHGFGIDEEYKLGMVRRPLGLPGEYLLVTFKTPVLCNGKEIPGGSGILFPPGTPHFFGLEKSSWIHSWIIFSCSSRKYEEKVKENFDPLLLPHLSCLAEMTKFHLLDGILIDSIMQNIFHLFLQDRKIHHSDMITKTLPMLLQPGRTPSLKKLAGKARLSVTRYSELFREIYHTSPIQYRLYSLLTDAKKLLLETDMTMEEIAGELGFSSPYYFSRQFRLKFGVSPGKMRKTRQER